jgi:hypothetical protein
MIQIRSRRYYPRTSQAKHKRALDLREKARTLKTRRKVSATKRGPVRLKIKGLIMVGAVTRHYRRLKLATKAIKMPETRRPNGSLQAGETKQKILRKRPKTTAAKKLHRISRRLNRQPVGETAGVRQLKGKMKTMMILVVTRVVGPTIMPTTRVVGQKIPLPTKRVVGRKIPLPTGVVGRKIPLPTGVVGRLSLKRVRKVIRLIRMAEVKVRKRGIKRRESKLEIITEAILQPLTKKTRRNGSSRTKIIKKSTSQPAIHQILPGRVLPFSSKADTGMRMPEL